MAAECKTVEFVFPTQSSGVAGGVTAALPPLSIVLPETGRKFVSVTLEVGCTDDLSGPAEATGFTIGFALASAALDEIVIGDPITGTGESRTYHLSRDLTNYFAEHYSEASNSAEVFLSVGNNATNNHWAKLRITYEYDSASPRQLKTIWLPIESTRDLLTTGYQTVGGDAAVPAIKGGTSIIPEHDPMVHQVWVELVGNQAASSTTSFELDLRLGVETAEESALYRVNASMATPGWLHAIWDVTGRSLSRPQALEAKLTGVTGRVAQLCGWVGITYEFSPVGTSLVWNSLQIPAFDHEDQHGASDSTRAGLHVSEVWVEEPESISLRPSQVFAFFDTDGGAGQLSLGVGTQSPRAFSLVAGGAPMVVGQRLDDGGVTGAGLELHRGRNRIKVRHHGDPAGGAVSAMNGFLLLNYTSGKASAGVGAHNQTRHFGIGWFSEGPLRGGVATRYEFSAETGARTPVVPFDRYFVTGVALQAAWMGSATGQRSLAVLAERAGVEGPSGDGAGWDSAYRGAIVAASEGWLRWTTAACSPLFRRWTGDPDTARLDLRTDRRWAVVDAAQFWVGSFGLLVTYHGITFAAKGTVSGAAGADLSEVSVGISSAATGETLLEFAVDADGRYQAAWFDDTEALVAEVYTSDGLVGRSAPFFASGPYEPPSPADPDPRLHSETHEQGGIDEIDVTGLSGVLAQPQIPSAHASTHGSGGGDALDVTGLVGILAQPQIPSAHASTHHSGGSDALDVTGLAGVLAQPQNPSVHASTHQSGGSDELDVTGLSGVLAQPQSPSSHAASHAAAGSDPIPAATTSDRGTVQLASDGSRTPGLAVQADDGRLIDARTPKTHASTHASGSTDEIKLDELGIPDDNSNLNASTSRHGLLRKLSGNSSQFLRGDGTWASLPSPPMPDVFLPASQVYLQSGAGWTAATLVESGGEKPYVSYPESASRYATWFFLMPAGYAGGALNFRFWYSGSVGSTASIDLRLLVERMTIGESMANSNNVASNIPVPGPLVAQFLRTYDHSPSNGELDGASAGDPIRIIINRESVDAYSGVFHLYAIQISQS